MKAKKLFGIALAGATLLSMSGCGQTNGASALKDAKDIYGMGAVTAVKLLGSEFSGEALARLSTVQALSASASQGEDLTEVKANAEKFHQYLNMLDGFFGEEVVSTTISTNSDTGYSEYANKLTITGKDMKGANVVHLMYYNETLRQEEQEEDEVEREFTLEGVLVMNEVNYPMLGSRSEEQEANESEAEIEIRAYLNAEDKGTYVQMKQETSVEAGEVEKEYVYSVYQNNALIEETAVEFEIERRENREKAEYEVEFLTGTARGEYSVKRVTNGTEVGLKVEYLVSGKRGTFTVKELVGAGGEVSYQYTFADGSTLTFGTQKEESGEQTAAV